MTTSDELGDLMQAALKGKTIAGDNVWQPRDYPATTAVFPLIVLNPFKEHKQSQGPNAPAYDVTSTMRLVGRVKGKAPAGPLTAAAVQTALGILQRQIERAVIIDWALFKKISQITTVDSEQSITAEGEQNVGELTMDMVLEFYQGTEEFAPVPSDPIAEIALYADLLDVADLLGTYTPPFAYPVAAAPRTQGPDGRVEIGALIELETESD